MKPAGLCQPPSKFDMFNFVVLHTMCLIFFPKMGKKQTFGFLFGKQKIGEQFSKGKYLPRMKL